MKGRCEFPRSPGPGATRVVKTRAGATNLPGIAPRHYAPMHRCPASLGLAATRKTKGGAGRRFNAIGKPEQPADVRS